MALSPAQKEAVRSFAAQRGLNLDEVLARAEEIAGVDDDGEESGLPSTVRDGFFAYQYQVLRVNEIRKSLGQPPATDGDLFYNEWLAKHGGSVAGVGKPTNEPE